MPVYQYEIQKANGKVATGTINAASISEASTQARALEGYLVNIAPASGGSEQNIFQQINNIRIETGPGLKDIMGFTKQLAVMVRAGISIREAIDGISEQVTNMRFQKALKKIHSDVESGTPFSAALAKHPKIFGPLYVDMVKASEMSGTFAHMLDRIASYLEQQHETQSMVKGAMIYPAVLFTMSIGAVVFLLTWVLPRFLVVFKGKEHLLPTPTKMLIAISEFMVNQWYVLLGGLIFAFLAIFYIIRTPKGSLAFDMLKLRLPVISKMFRAMYLTRSLQTMGELINAGVPMLETLEITGEVSGNQHYKAMWFRVRDAVQEGRKIVHPLMEDGMLPKAVVQMISAGEESGKLGEVLSDVSEFYARELKDVIKATTAMIEPLMIVFMGVIIGFIAMSIILPVFKMSSIMTQQ